MRGPLKRHRQGSVLPLSPQGRGAIQSLVAVATMERPVGVPLPIEADGAEVQHPLRTCAGPGHAPLLQAILDQMLARPLHDARPNRPAAVKVQVMWLCASGSVASASKATITAAVCPWSNRSKWARTQAARWV